MCISRSFLETYQGHLEFGEQWDECAARETLEETGLQVKNLSFGTVVNAIKSEENYHYVTVFMVGSVEKGLENSKPVNTEPDKCEGWSWVDWRMENEGTDDRFPTPLFKALELAREEGFNPFGVQLNKSL